MSLSGPVVIPGVPVSPIRPAGKGNRQRLCCIYSIFACGTTIILRFLGCSEFGNRLSSFEVALLHILYQHADERETSQKNRKSMAEEECMNFEERKQSSLISCCAQGSF